MITNYSLCKHLIREADVILFRKSNFPSVSWWIGLYSQSPYSHIGLAHWDKGELYCLEFREFKGSRTYLMNDYIKEEENRIDIFRVCDKIKFTGTDPKDTIEKEFTPTIAKDITNYALELMAKYNKYGWQLIWKIWRTYLPFVRVWRNVKYDDSNGSIYVCSTLVTQTYRKHYLDPVPFLADEYTKPGDIARSAILRRIFSISV